MIQKLLWKNFLIFCCTGCAVHCACQYTLEPSAILKLDGQFNMVQAEVTWPLHILFAPKKRSMQWQDFCQLRVYQRAQIGCRLSAHCGNTALTECEIETSVTIKTDYKSSHEDVNLCWHFSETHKDQFWSTTYSGVEQETGFIVVGCAGA